MPDRGRGGDLKPPGQDLLSAIVLADSFNQVHKYIVEAGKLDQRSTINDISAVGACSLRVCGVVILTSDAVAAGSRAFGSACEGVRPKTLMMPWDMGYGINCNVTNLAPDSINDAAVAGRCSGSGP